MVDYRELYTMYEEQNNLNPNIPETTTAESELEKALRVLNDDLVFELDMLIGRVVRAYEMQGFLFGLNYGYTHG